MTAKTEIDRVDSQIQSQDFQNYKNGRKSKRIVDTSKIKRVQGALAVLVLGREPGSPSPARFSSGFCREKRRVEAIAFAHVAISASPICLFNSYFLPNVFGQGRLGQLEVPSKQNKFPDTSLWRFGVYG